MAESLTLAQVEALAVQLPPQEQLKLMAHISAQLSELPRLTPETDEEQLRRERLARTKAILALCDAAAERFDGESDAVEDIRRMRDERIEQICQRDA